MVTGQQFASFKEKYGPPPPATATPPPPNAAAPTTAASASAAPSIDLKAVAPPAAASSAAASAAAGGVQVMAPPPPAQCPITGKAGASAFPPSQVQAGGWFAFMLPGTKVAVVQKVCAKPSLRCAQTARVLSGMVWCREICSASNELMGWGKRQAVCPALRCAVRN
jgi:hypothetical protein